MIPAMMLLAIPGVIDLKYPFLLPYAYHRFLHIISAAVVIGNLTVSGIWLALAGRTRDLSVLHFGANTAHRLDAVLTGPAFLLLIYNGMTLAGRLGGLYSNGWITAGFVTLCFTVIVWISFMVRYQQRLCDLIHNAHQSKKPLPEEAYTILNRHTLGCGLTVLSLLTALVLMVTKPKLW
jgi:uncharacterized membrane protein